MDSGEAPQPSTLITTLTPEEIRQFSATRLPERRHSIASKTSREQSNVTDRIVASRRSYSIGLSGILALAGMVNLLATWILGP